MATRVVSRETESRAVDDLLSEVSSGPSALLVEGEAGIGKTTVWLAALERAQERGFTVLSTRAAAAESVLSYSALAAMLEGLDDAAFDGLPSLQRLAIDRVMLRVSAAEGPATDQREVGAGFLAVVEGLAEQSPVLLAIDDLQWLDPASRLIVSSAARRLAGPVGLLATVRTEDDTGSAGSMLELHRPDRVQRTRLRPLSLGALHTVIFERLHKSFPRPKMLWIEQVSGGNPFFALEMARAMVDDQGDVRTSLPSTLADLVRSRIGSMADDAEEVLLATACLADPTVEVVARATNLGVDQTLAVLAEAEGKGIVEIDGQHLRFAHPLLIRGVYSNTSPARRRAMHRRLAETIEEPELTARHLALAATSGDQQTLRALDSAAELARMRGAPGAAAELLELAIGLGGDTPERQIRAAGHHFEAGDPAAARARLEPTIERLTPGRLRADAMSQLAVVRLYDDSLPEAAELLEAAIDESSDDDARRVPMSIMLSFALFNDDRPEPALKRVDEAVSYASRQERPELLGQALAMRVMLRFLVGYGVDEADLKRALSLAGHLPGVPLAARPDVISALLVAWTGRLDAAADELAAIGHRCRERGEESELTFVNFHGALVEMWRGNITESERIAEDTMERALQLSGDFPLFIALTLRTMVGGYAGRVEEVRRDTTDALAAAARCGSHRLAEWTVTNLGFLEVSLGRYEEALRTLAPLLVKLDNRPQSTEIIAAAFVPDAAEAMIGLGRLDDADRIVGLLEGNGRRLDRAWMLAVGARCRSMLLAARGDLEAAYGAAQHAMSEHDRLQMPFERARTELLLGQLQRRQRHRDAAAATLSNALSTFEELGAVLWARRARAELSRASVLRGQDAALSATEQRVAELAASGATNRDMAAALFISPKTVEANLSRIYRKLDIHSRAELGRFVGTVDE